MLFTSKLDTFYKKHMAQKSRSHVKGRRVYFKKVGGYHEIVRDFEGLGNSASDNVTDGSENQNLVTHNPKSASRSTLRKVIKELGWQKLK